MKATEIIKINRALDELAEQGVVDNDLIRAGMDMFGSSLEGLIRALVMDDDIVQTVKNFIDVEI